MRRRAVLKAGLVTTSVTAGVGGCSAANGVSSRNESVPESPHQPAIASAVFVAIDRSTGSLKPVFRTLGAKPPGVDIAVAVGASLFDNRFGLAKVRAGAVGCRISQSAGNRNRTAET
jgi:hypothetical protein